MGSGFQLVLIERAAGSFVVLMFVSVIRGFPRFAKADPAI